MTINLLNCNLGIRRLWRGVSCDLKACLEAPQMIAAPWRKESSIFTFSDSSSLKALNRNAYLELVARECAQAVDFLLAKNQQERQIVIGGDHMVSFASLLADLRRFPASEVALLMFDSHDDFNLTAESETGNFHGMWVRPFFTHFDNIDIEALVAQKIPLENLLYVGNLDMETPVANFFREKKIRVLGQQQWQKDFAGTLKQLQSFVDQFPHLHLSFDLDVIAGKVDFAQATSGNWAVNLPYEQGLPLPLVQKIYQQLHLPKTFNFDLVEYNGSRLTAAESTLAFAQEMIQWVLAG
ncbi:MAG: arginase family protein [bacterium]|nr:arginase family protein [bacterium]